MEPDRTATSDAALRRRLSLGVCVFLLVVAVTVAVNHSVHAIHAWYDLPDSAAKRPNGDFSYYYVAGASWRAGLDPYLRLVSDHDDVSRLRGERFSYYVYPPTALPLFGGLSRLDYDDARWLWLVLGLTAFVALVTFAAESAGERGLEVVAVVALLVVSSNPLQYLIGRGQADLIVCSLATMAFLFYRRWGSWPSAVLLAVAIVLKTAPLFVLAGLVLYHRDLRFLVRTAACAAAVVALSLVTVAPHLYVEYVRDVLPSVSEGVATVGNQSALRHLGNGPVPAVLGALGTLAFLALFYALGREPARSADRAGARPSWPDRSELEVFLLMVTLMLLVSPVAWRSWFVWTIVPLAALLVAELHDGRLGAIVGLSLAGCLWSLRVYESMVYDLDLGAFTVYQFPALTAPQLWGSVAALVTLATVIVGDRRRAATGAAPSGP